MRKFLPLAVALLFFTGLACVPHKAEAALTYVGSAEGSGSDTGSSVDLTGLSLQEGDLVIVASGYDFISDGNPGVGTAGYTEVQDLYANGPTYDANFSVSWKIMGATPDTSVSCNGSPSSVYGSACEAYVWRGADQTTPLDVSSATAAASAVEVPDCPAITPVTSGAVVVCTGIGAAAGGDTAVTAPSGYGNQADISVDPGSAAVVGVASKAWSGSGAEDPAAWTNWSQSGTVQASWIAVTLAIRPAADAPAATGRIIRLTGGMRLVGGVRLGGSSPVPSSVCSQATAFLARVTVDSTHQAAYKNLICGLVTDGLWGKFDALYIFATANSSAALTNLVSAAYSATSHGSPAFAADQGFTTGSDQWVDTGVNLSTAANFTQDSAMFGAWNLTATPDYNSIVMAAESFGGVNYLRPNDANCPSGCMSGEVNSSSVFDTGDGSIASGAGLVIGNRPDSTRFQFWQNTTQVGGDMIRGSTAPDNAVLETAGDATAYANNGAFQIAAVFAGAGLTSTDISNFYGRMRAYMTAVGLP